MKQLTLEINERQEEEELQVNIYIHMGSSAQDGENEQYLS